MTFLYHKVMDDGSVLFTFKVGSSPHRQLPMGKISRKLVPAVQGAGPDTIDITIIENYEIELKIEARNGLTELSMVRKQSEKKEDLPHVSDASHRS